MASGIQPLDVFISYSHVDQNLKDELIKHLSPLKRQGLVRHWHDRQITAGSDWARDIDAQLEAADVILVLISPDFIHSDYCYEKEMALAIDRHLRGECCVIPVFLRACDWKGLPFGKIQGLPDDAIPIVSTSWGSRDEAFTRVAQGIRRLVESWSARIVTTSVPGSTSANVSSASVGKKPVIAPRQEIGEIGDSGPGVLLGDDYFESESVTEGDEGRVVVRIIPNSAEEEATLRQLKGEPPFHNSQIKFAHGNEAFTARVVSSRLASTGGNRTWSIELEPANRSREIFDDISVNRIGPEEIATARARLLLLGEHPSGKMEEASMWIKNLASRGGTEEIAGSVIPDVWHRSGGDVVKFLRWARLIAIHALTSTNTCEHILELILRLQPGNAVFIKFTGQRRTSYQEPSRISVEGTISLEPPKNETRNRRR